MFLFILLIPSSLPLDLVKAVPSQQRIFHRLVYRCFPVHEQNRRDPIATDFIWLEAPLVDLKRVETPVGSSGGSGLAGMMCWSGSSANLDVLMPERYDSSSFVSKPHLMVVLYVSLMDLRFIISDMDPLAFGILPGKIHSYLNDLRKLCVLQVFYLSDTGLIRLQFDFR